MKNMIGPLLLINLIILAGCTSPGKSSLKALDSITGPETKEEACKALVARAMETRLYPKIGKECLFCELEEDDGHVFFLALRYDAGKCGGDWTSNLLDRFLVFQRSPIILWYDSTEDRFLPWEYAFTYSDVK